MIIKRRGIYVTEKHAVPMMGVCKAIGSGYNLNEIKQIYPVTDEDTLDCINFFCKYTEFDPYHILTFKKLEFSECQIEIQIQETSAECFMRMLNRSIYLNGRVKDFNEMFVEGLNISMENACKLLAGRLTEADLLNPILDKSLANEIEMFMDMTKRSATSQIKKLDLEAWSNNDLILLDSD